MYLLPSGYQFWSKVSKIAFDEGPEKYLKEGPMKMPDLGS